MAIFRKPVPQDPLVVAMSGARLGHRVVIAPSKHDDVVLAIAGKVGLTGHVAIATEDGQRRDALASRALNAGLLVETDTGLEPRPDEAPFDIAIVDARGNGAALDAALLASLYRRLRQGGRLILLVPAGGSGMSALLGSGAEPDTSAETAALLSAGFRTARLLATRERIAFVEALKA
jgi:SAM-dependent methyltransferase